MDRLPTLFILAKLLELLKKQINHQKRETKHQPKEINHPARVQTRTAQVVAVVGKHADAANNPSPADIQPEDDDDSI